MRLRHFAPTKAATVLDPFDGSARRRQHQAPVFEVVRALQEMHVSLVVVVGCECDFYGALYSGIGPSRRASSSISPCRSLVARSRLSLNPRIAARGKGRAPKGPALSLPKRGSPT